VAVHGAHAPLQALLASKPVMARRMFALVTKALKATVRGAGAHNFYHIALRMALYIATAQGLCSMAWHARRTFHAVASCWSSHFVWAAPLQAVHLTSAITRVIFRRLVGAPKCARWSLLVELFVEAVRPRQTFLTNWESCVAPCLQMLTLLDYHGETWARLCHPGVRMEWHTQACPRPMTWVWFPEAVDAGARSSDEASAAGEEGGSAPEDSEELVMLFLHGGGYWAFTGKSHLEYVARLTREMGRVARCRMRACVVDTRRAPEYPWPAPIEDALACYDWLQAGCGYKPSQIVLGGDSAGGGLCLCVLLALRDAGKELPLCAMVVSPLTDLSRSEEHYKNVADLNDFLPAEAALKSSVYYANGADARHPYISPKYGQLHALPPVLVQAGEGELLERDAIEYARRLEAYGGSVKLEMYPDMPHIFPMLACLGLKDGHTAIRRQAKFVRRVLGGSAASPDGRSGGRRLRILVHNGRTHSFEDVQMNLRISEMPMARLGSSSSPLLTDLAAQCGPIGGQRSRRGFPSRGES